MKKIILSTVLLISTAASAALDCQGHTVISKSSKTMVSYLKPEAGDQSVLTATFDTTKFEVQLISDTKIVAAILDSKANGSVKILAQYSGLVSNEPGEFMLLNSTNARGLDVMLSCQVK